MISLSSKKTVAFLITLIAGNHTIHIHNTGWLCKMDERKSQAWKFKEAARQLETDNDEERFVEIHQRLAKPKPDEKKPSDD